jgi:hypothetical protein
MHIACRASGGKSHATMHIALLIAPVNLIDELFAFLYYFEGTFFVFEEEGRKEKPLKVIAI